MSSKKLILCLFSFFGPVLSRSYSKEVATFSKNLSLYHEKQSVSCKAKKGLLVSWTGVNLSACVAMYMAAAPAAVFVAPALLVLGGVNLVIYEVDRLKNAVDPKVASKQLLKQQKNLSSSLVDFSRESCLAKVFTDEEVVFELKNIASEISLLYLKQNVLLEFLEKNNPALLMTTKHLFEEGMIDLHGDICDSVERRFLPSLQICKLLLEDRTSEVNRTDYPMLSKASLAEKVLDSVSCVKDSFKIYNSFGKNIDPKLVSVLGESFDEISILLYEMKKSPLYRTELLTQREEEEKKARLVSDLEEAKKKLKLMDAEISAKKAATRYLNVATVLDSANFLLSAKK